MHRSLRSRMLLLPVSLVALLISCSSASNTPPVIPPGANASVVSGFVVDAFVAGASISAYQVTSTGAVGTLVAGPVVTSATGAYSLSLGTYTGPVLLQSTGGTYKDTTTGTTVNLAGTGLTLSALVPSATANVTAQVTPLSTMAAQVALTLIGEGTDPATAANTANSAIGSFFGLSNLLSTALLDLTQAGCAGGASQVSIDESFVLAGLSELAKTAGTNPYSLLIALLQDITSDGVFDGTVGGVPINVPLTAGGTVTLGSIEAGAAAQVAAGGLPGLAQAIATFQASAGNVCNAVPSGTLGTTISDPAAPTPPGIGTTLTVPMVVLGNLTAPIGLHFQTFLTPAASTLSTYTGGGIKVTIGGQYSLYIPAPASALSGAATVTVVRPPANETCALSSSGSGGTSTLDVTFSNGFSPIFMDCTLTSVSYSVGGTVTGLASGTRLTLTDAVSNATTTVTGGITPSNFVLDPNLPSGTPYSVTLAPPSGQTCTTSTGSAPLSGTVTAAVSLAITCSATSGTGGTGGTGIALDGPSGLVFDAHGNLYVANGGANQVLVYKEQLDASFHVTGLTETASIATGLSQPVRLAFDTAGDLYVANAASGTVTVYDTSLNQILKGTISGLDRPLGVAVDASGNVYVANNGSNNVAIYSGSPSSGFTLASTLSQDATYTQFLAPGTLTFAPLEGANLLFVGLGPGSGADSVEVYQTPLAANSAPLVGFSNYMCQTGPSGPTGTAVYDSGSVATSLLYVSNYYASTVTAYNVGNSLGGGPCPALAATSGANSQIAQPEGVAVDAHGNVFVANSSSNTVTVYTSIAAAPVYTQK